MTEREMLIIEAAIEVGIAEQGSNIGVKSIPVELMVSIVQERFILKESPLSNSEAKLLTNTLNKISQQFIDIEEIAVDNFHNIHTERENLTLE